MTARGIPIILSIAGTDPIGGAGLQADIKTISATGGYAASVVTALVAQNTQGVQAIQSVPSTFIEKQLLSVFSDVNPKAVKIGMLNEASVIEAVVDCLSEHPEPLVVVDPVMVAKDGSKLLQEHTLQSLKQQLLPKANLITPNLQEAQILLEQDIQGYEAMQEAAQSLAFELKTNVLIKGGHFDSLNEANDVLFCWSHKAWHWFKSPRIHTRHTHGTGCSLSSAIASYWGQGYTLYEAIAKAKHYMSEAITYGMHLHVGQGNGPIDHFYASRVLQRGV